MWLPLVLLFTTVLGGSALADARAAELRAACTSDAMKICSWSELRQAATGNYGGISACFHFHRAELSAGCLVAVHHRHGH